MPRFPLVSGAALAVLMAAAPAMAAESIFIEEARLVGRGGEATLSAIRRAGDVLVAVGTAAEPDRKTDAAWAGGLSLDRLTPLWEAALHPSGSRNASIAAIARMTNGDAVLVGTAEQVRGRTSTRNWIARIDPRTGARKWLVDYPGVRGSRLVSVAGTADGGVVLAGRLAVEGGGAWDGWVVRLDGAGNELWDRHYGGTGSEGFLTIQPLAGNTFLAAGVQARSAARLEDAWLLKLDGKGRRLWEKSFGRSGADALTDLAPLEDGSVLAVGRSNAGSEAVKAEGWVVRLDPKGQVVCQHYLGGAPSRLDRVLVLPGGSFAGLGSVTPEAGKPMAGWLVAMDGACNVLDSAPLSEDAAAGFQGAEVIETGETYARIAAVGMAGKRGWLVTATLQPQDSLSTALDHLGRALAEGQEGDAAAEARRLAQADAAIIEAAYPLFGDYRRLARAAAAAIAARRDTTPGAAPALLLDAMHDTLLAVAEPGGGASLLTLIGAALQADTLLPLPAEARLVPARAVRLLTAQAEAGDVVAALMLAPLVEQGRGVTADPARALALYRQALGQEREAAAANIVRLLERLAQSGDGAALLDLALLYEKGEQVPMDADRAYALARIAHAAGNGAATAVMEQVLRPRAKADEPAAMLELARMIEQGILTAPLDEALALYDRLATVKGVAEARPGSLRLLHRMAERGDAEALFRLAGLYGGGEGVPADARRADWLLLRAAAAGHAGALDLVERHSWGVFLETHPELAQPLAAGRPDDVLVFFNAEAPEVRNGAAALVPPGRVTSSVPLALEVSPALYHGLANPAWEREAVYRFASVGLDAGVTFQERASRPFEQRPALIAVQRGELGQMPLFGEAGARLAWIRALDEGSVMPFFVLNAR